jgi:phenylacetate-CoA ligase
MDARCRAAGVDLQDLASNIDADPFRLPFLWIYGRKDSTVSVMGSNIYPEDLEQSLYDEPDLAALTHSFCLQLQEEPGGSVRPRFSFEVRSPIDEELQRKFDERIVERLRSLNADFREAMQEYEETVTPVIRLYSMGSGPFAGDAAKIKQTRILKPPGGGAVASRNPGR